MSFVIRIFSRPAVSFLLFPSFCRLELGNGNSDRGGRRPIWAGRDAYPKNEECRATRPGTRFLFLFSQAEATNDLLVARAVFPRQVLQKLVASADQLQKSSSRGVIFLMGIKVRPQIINAVGNQRDLHFG